MKKKVNLLLLGVASISMVLASCGNPGGGGKVAPSLTGIHVKQGPTKTTYLVNETINLAGLVVEALYSDDTKTEVSNYTTNAADVDMSFAGTKTVVVTFEEKTDSFTVTVRNSAATDWSEKAKSYMDEECYGVYLPYPDIKNVDLVGNIFYGYHFEGEIVGKDDLKLYASQFRGWKGGDVGQQAGYGAGCFYMFEKGFSVNVGSETEPEMANRYLRVMFANLDTTTSSPSPTGTVFYMMVSDPYYYSWDEINLPKDWAKDVYSENILPAPEGTIDHLDVDDEDNYCIDAYISENNEEAYKTQLETAGWHIHEEKDEYGYYVAESPDNLYSVAFAYSVTGGYLSIYFEAAYIWPAASIAGYQAAKSVEFEVPEFEGTDLQFLAYPSSSGYYVIQISGVEGLEAYATKLETAGWDLEKTILGEDPNLVLAEFDAEKLVEEKGYVRISAELAASEDELYAVLHIYGSYTAFTTTWPTNMIKGTTDTVPEVAMANLGYNYSSGTSSSVLKVKNEKGNLDAALEAYIGQLTTAGWEAFGEYYVSPNHELKVTFSEDLHDVFVATFSSESRENLSHDWPTEIANGYPAAFGSEGTVPAFAGADFYYTSTANKAVFAVVASDYEGNPETNYATALETAGFTVQEDKDSYGYNVAHSADGKFRIVFLFQSSTSTLRIYVEDDAAPVWPGDKITAALVAEAGAKKPFTDSVPSLDISNADECNISDSAATIELELRYSKVSDVQAVEAEFEAALAEAGYTETHTIDIYDGGVEMTSAHGEITIIYGVDYFHEGQNEKVFNILVISNLHEAVFDKLSDYIAALFEEGHEFKDKFPEIEIPSNVSGSDVKGDSSSATFRAYFESEEAAEQFAAQVKAAITAEGYDYVVRSDGTYATANEEVMLKIYVDDSYAAWYGIYMVYVEVYKYQPVFTDQVAEAVKTMLGEELVDSIPTFEFGELDSSGAGEYFFGGNPVLDTEEEGRVQVIATYYEIEEGEEFAASYAAALVEEGYSLIQDVTGPNGESVYQSENGQIEVQILAGQDPMEYGYGVVYVSFYKVGDAPRAA